MDSIASALNSGLPGPLLKTQPLQSTSLDWHHEAKAQPRNQD